jgi:hypothetical protein
MGRDRAGAAEFSGEPPTSSRSARRCPQTLARLLHYGADEWRPRVERPGGRSSFTGEIGPLALSRELFSRIRGFSPHGGSVDGLPVGELRTSNWSPIARPERFAISQLVAVQSTLQTSRNFCQRRSGNLGAIRREKSNRSRPRKGGSMSAHQRRGRNVNTRHRPNAARSSS